MEWHVIDKESMRYFEKPNGSKVWSLSKADAMRLSEGAIVVALSERNLNESLNVYYQRRLFEQIHYDPHLGWVS